MRLTILTTGLVAATLTETVHGWASCSKTSPVWGIVGYAVTAGGVDDIPGICGGLWDNLKHFHDCIGVGVPYCGKNSDGNLVWKFSNGSGCNSGMIHSAWWEATRNRFGSINCQVV